MLSQSSQISIASGSSRASTRGEAENVKLHRVRVVARVRPRIAEDVELNQSHFVSEDDECVVEDPQANTIQLLKPYFDTREFGLDCVLGRDATQAQTYEAVGRPVVDDVLAGFNGTLLAHGQTGTGKTYTIYGPLSYWRRAPIGMGVGGGLGRVAPTAAAPPLELQPHLELSGVVTRAAMQIFGHAEALRAKGTRLRVRISSLTTQVQNRLFVIEARDRDRAARALPCRARAARRAARANRPPARRSSATRPCSCAQSRSK